MSMRLLFTLLSVLIASSITYGQNPYYDALQLSKETDTAGKLNKNTKVTTILDNYFEPETTNSPSEIYDAFDPTPVNPNDPNPFIQFTSPAHSFVPFTSVKSSIESIGGFNVTNIADGLAKFLVERTKQELTITFFEKFKEELDDYEELKIIFPKTHSLLLAMGDEIYNFSAYINMLRETFEEDLKNIIPNLRVLLHSEALQTYLTINPTIKSILNNALIVAEELQNGEHPGDIISRLKNENLNDSTIRNFSPGLQTLDLFSQSLKSKQNDRYWISSDSLRLMINDEITLKIYLGLIYQQSEGIKFVNKNGIAKNSLRDILRLVNNKYNENKGPVKVYLETLISRAQRVDQSLKTIKKLNDKEGQRSSYSEHYEFYTASIDLIEHSISIKSIPAIDSLIYFDLMRLNKYFDIAHTAGDLYLDVREKNYFSAVINLNLVLEKSIPSYSKEIGQKLTSVDSLISSLERAKTTASGKVVAQEALAFLNENGAFIVGEDYFLKIENNAEALLKDHNPAANDTIKDNIDSALTNIKEFLENNKSKIPNSLIEKYNDILPKLLKYGNLAASIAKAESSDEVEKIIESIALPAGSARIKRDSKFNIALNAYMGLYAGYENIEVNDKHNYQFATGLSAPVGVTLSLGNIKGDDPKKGGKSLSLLLSLIDIGAIASFRFNDSDTESVPEIQLKDIISPGAFVVFGFGKIPLSAGAGYQIGPRLHEVTAQSNTVGDTYGRASFFIAVDIPILNFHTTPKVP